MRCGTSRSSSSSGSTVYEPLSTRDIEEGRAITSLGIFAEGFEREDDPEVDLDVVKADDDPPMIKSLITHTTVTTFLAGFAGNDFSSFSYDEWEDSHPVVVYVYAFLMAFVIGNCFYLSVTGVMTGAVYYRAVNQEASWSVMVEKTLRPVKEDFRSLCGERLTSCQKVLASLIDSNTDWQNTYGLAGHVSNMINVIPDASRESKWVMQIDTPSRLMATSLAFKLVARRSFKVAVLFYVVALGLKAMKGAPSPMVVMVAVVLGGWMLLLVGSLHGIYSKLND